MDSFSNRKVVLTEDGSSTIFLPELNEHYHSIHGARQESLHVFMKMGFDVVAKKLDKISILEIGFGTGLNAFLVLLESLNVGKLKNFEVTYTALEAFPVSIEDVSLLNYFSNAEERLMFLKLHQAKWNEAVDISIEPKFSLTKLETKLENFTSKENQFDLVFFDAFSPDKQPELWTEEIFRKVFSAMKKGGILVTYCAKGQVRRNMIAAGFTVERLQGPPGKREMLRGEHNSNHMHNADS